MEQEKGLPFSLEGIYGLDREFRRTSMNLAEGRNFALTEVEEGELVLVNNDTSIAPLSIQDILPKEWRLMRGVQYGANTAEQVLKYPQDDLAYYGSVLSILHEVGHTYRRGYNEELKYQGIFAGGPKEKAKIAGVGLLKFIANPGGIFQVMDDLSNNGKAYAMESLRINYLPRKYLERCYDVRAQVEIEAWEFALQKAFELEARGYNVFAEFDNDSENVMDFINGCLASYDIGMWGSLKENANYRSVRKFEPKFVRYRRYYL